MSNLTELLFDSSSIYSNIHPDVKKSFGCALPKKFDTLLHLFAAMENVVSIAHSRNMKITFDDVSKNVSKQTQIKFTETHLGQIIGVYSNSYKLRWEKRRQLVGRPLGEKPFQLILCPNLTNDLSPFFLKSPVFQKNLTQKKTLLTKNSNNLIKSPSKISKLNVSTTIENNLKPLNSEENLCSTSNIINKSSKPLKVCKNEENESILELTKLSKPNFSSPTKENFLQDQEKKFDVNDLILKTLPKTLTTPTKNGNNTQLKCSPKTPITPMQSLSFSEKFNKKQQITNTKKTKNVFLPVAKTNFEKQSNDLHNNFVSPIKLISPIKRKNEHDYIKRSPMKTPMVPVPRLAQVDPGPKFQGWRKIVRKMIFRHLLVLKLLESQTKFLKENNLNLSPGVTLHSKFNINKNVDDLPIGEIPQMPELNVTLCTPQAYFKSLPKIEETETIINVQKNSPVSTQKNTPSGLKQTAKISLLERIKAKEMSKKFIDKEKISELKNEEIFLQLLNKSMIEVICSHYNLRKARGMNINSLLPLVILACGQMDKENFKNHIDVLCAAAPNFCKKEIHNNQTFLKIIENRVDKIKHCIEERLEIVQRELRSVK